MMTFSESKFSIQGKDFFCLPSLLDKNSFAVKSMPRDYTVCFDENVDPFYQVKKILAENEKNLLLIDEKLILLYQPDWKGDPKRILAAPATEIFKSLDGVKKVLDFLQQNQFTKAEKLIVVGGGTIQEVGTFAGAIYKRGISWVHFPTTLLSMSDSCIGGKAGINYNSAKNQLGLFSTPSAVQINLGFLRTLTQSEIYSGLGEILKLCIIGGESLLRLYKDHVVDGRAQAGGLKKLIMAALSVKKAVVEEDEFETNYRRSMNYGHTLGHAIESLSNYQIPHGQAVVLGMILVNLLSHEQGLLPKAALDQLNAACFDLVTDDVMENLQKIKTASIMDLIQKDKKTIGEETVFVLMKKPGDTVFLGLKRDEVLLKRIQAAFDQLKIR